MRNFFNIILLIISVSILFACSTIKSGFQSERKNSTEEFLVEKKKPLVMPPNYEELPIPKTNSSEKNLEENEIKKLIISEENGNVSSDNENDINKTLEKSIIEKIKNN